MNLSVGDRILIEFSTFGDRFLSVVANMDNDDRLIVYSPITDTVVRRLKTDSFARVKFAQDGRLMGFSTQVLNKIEVPGCLLELAMPDTCYDAEEREDPRCSCNFPAVIVDGGKVIQAVIEDMSSNCSRVRFITEGLAPFIEDTKREVRMTFYPFDSKGDGYSVGCVVKSSFLKEGRNYAVLEFNKDEENVRRRIARFIEAQRSCGISRI